MKSTDDSQNLPDNPKGRLLRTQHLMTGYSRAVLDNGVASTITIQCRSEDLPQLLGSDLKAIQEHLMTRKPGRYRKKGSNTSEPTAI